MNGLYIPAVLSVAALVAVADVEEIRPLRQSAEVADVSTGGMCRIYEGQLVYASKVDQKERGLTKSHTHTAVRILIGNLFSNPDDCERDVLMILPNDFIRQAR